MHLDIAQEKQLQYEKDRAAYETLSDRQRRVTNNLADFAFRNRVFAAKYGKWFLFTADRFIQYALLGPYKAVGKLVKWISDGSVKLVKLGLQGAVRFRLHFSKNKHNDGWREKMLAWEKKKLADIDKWWHEKKAKMKGAATSVGHFLDRRGVLGLYNIMKWILNPRRPSGKPLLGHEKLNKTVGTVIGLFAFFALSTQLLKLTIIANVWHYQIAQFVIAQKLPFVPKIAIPLKIAQEVAGHLLVTLIVTGAKFVSLPVIAASRQALKSTSFSQGIAFQYNNRLRTMAHVQKPANKSGRVSSFVTGILSKIAEKASPEYYEAKKKYLQQQDEAKKDALKDIKLTPAFNEAEQPSNAPAPSAPQPPTPPPSAPS